VNSNYWMLTSVLDSLLNARWSSFVGKKFQLWKEQLFNFNDKDDIKCWMSSSASYSPLDAVWCKILIRKFWHLTCCQQLYYLTISPYKTKVVKKSNCITLNDTIEYKAIVECQVVQLVHSWMPSGMV